MNMNAMTLASKSHGRWLEMSNVPSGEPGEGEVLIRIDVCGVCRTDLHIVEGNLSLAGPGLIPGHEIVGTVVKTGEHVHSLRPGDTVGVPWLHGTCGVCEFCASGRENLCRRKTFTGYTVNGGFAEYVIAREAFSIPIGRGMSPVQTAPLLCSGIIGYRAFKLARPPPGGILGIFGFGGSAHITLQIALALGYDVRVTTRNERHLELAMQLGATRAIGPHRADAAAAKGSLDAAIVFAPSGLVVRSALESVGPGGIVAVPAIHMDAISLPDYELHLFHEKKLFSVEANTRADALEFMKLAARVGVRSVVKEFRLEDANTALSQLKAGEINGSAVLRIT